MAPYHALFGPTGCPVASAVSCQHPPTTKSLHTYECVEKETNNTTIFEKLLLLVPDMKTCFATVKDSDSFTERMKGLRVAYLAKWHSDCVRGTLCVIAYSNTPKTSWPCKALPY